MRRNGLIRVLSSKRGLSSNKAVFGTIAGIFGIMIVLSSSFAGPFFSHAYISESTTTETQASTNSLSYPIMKSPLPATSIDVVNARRPLSYTLIALEGIVARTQPKIFAITTSDDQSWLQYTAKYYGLSYQNESTTQILQQFASYVEDSNGNVKIVLYDSNDPIFPTQVNIARTLAGVYSALPVPSDALSTIQSIFGSKIDTLCII